LPAPWYRWDGEDLLLAVHVQPGARADRIDGCHGDRLKIRISAPPVDGKANDHLLRHLAGLFDVPLRSVSLLSGAGARAKRVRIRQPARLLAEITSARVQVVAPPRARH
jgi:uncharacterized protein (TIGR00251 family)